MAASEKEESAFTSLASWIPYFGGKNALASRLPEPNYTTIVEPFSGMASYSVFHLNKVKRVVLFDTSPKVGSVWRMLTSPDALDKVSSIPMFCDKNETLESAKFASLCEGQRALVEFYMQPNSRPNATHVIPGSRCRWSPRSKARLLELIPDLVAKVEFVQESFEEAFRRYSRRNDVTWFVDPPYERTLSESLDRRTGAGGGTYGKHGNVHIDYTRLAELCKTASGQCIACDRSTATWLPFSTHTLMPTTDNKRVCPEGVWHSSKEVSFMHSYFKRPRHTEEDHGERVCTSTQ